MKDIIPFWVYTVFVTKTNTKQRMMPFSAAGCEYEVAHDTLFGAKISFITRIYSSHRIFIL